MCLLPLLASQCSLCWDDSHSYLCLLDKSSYLSKWRVCPNVVPFFIFWFLFYAWCFHTIPCSIFWFLFYAWCFHTIPCSIFWFLFYAWCFHTIPCFLCDISCHSSVRRKGSQSRQLYWWCWWEPSWQHCKSLWSPVPLVPAMCPSQ